MTTLDQTLSKSVASPSDDQLSLFDLGYLKAAAEDEAHEVVLRIFLTESQNDASVNKAFLAKRSGKKPEQITRLLSASGNWTLDTFAVLLGAMGYKATFGAQKISDMRWDNYCHPMAIKKQVAVIPTQVQWTKGSLGSTHLPVGQIGPQVSVTINLNP